MCRPPPAGPEYRQEKKQRNMMVRDPLQLLRLEQNEGLVDPA